MWCYENDDNNKIRYILGENGKTPIFCIGINPSTAEPNHLDRTVNRVRVISIKNNFDGWFMLNIYPQRATNPDELDHCCKSKNHKKNIDFIDEYLIKYDKPVIWAAWGILIEKRPYLFDCLRDIFNIAKEYNSKWITFGNITKKSHPRHPLYLPINSKKLDFDILSYIENNTKTC